MPIDILSVVIVTAIVQSIFGVGVLLFGTPLLLLLGHTFADALAVLLPISIAINSLQIIKHYRFIDLGFCKGVLIYSIPLVVLFLFVAVSTPINLGLIIGAFLIVVAAKNFNARVEQLLIPLMRYQKTYLVLMGVVHGLTNLGGSLLTAVVHHNNYDKQTTRVTVATCYATFAVFQLATLLFLGNGYPANYQATSYLVQIGTIVFLLTEEILFDEIDNNKYSKIFALFLLASGILLIIKSV